LFAVQTWFKRKTFDIGKKKKLVVVWMAIFLLTMHCTLKIKFMKVITILAALTISMLFCYSAKGQVVDTTYNKRLLKEINNQNRKITSGLLISGVSIIIGSAVSINATFDEAPKSENFGNVVSYQDALNRYEKSQKRFNVTSTVFIGLGGIALFITGMNIARIKINKDSPKTIGAVINENGIGIAYIFN
jgi:hypothetical protein